MKKNILVTTLTSIVLLSSATTMANQPMQGRWNNGSDNNVQQCQNQANGGQQRGMMNGNMNRHNNNQRGMGHMRMRMRDQLFSVSMKSDNPQETLKTIATSLPKGEAKQYQVSVSIIEVPEPTTINKPNNN